MEPNRERIEDEKEEREAWVEGQKLYHDTAKTQALITTALLGASGAAASFIPRAEYVQLLIFAAGLGIISLLAALLVMQATAVEVMRRRTGIGVPLWMWNVIVLVYVGTFGLGLVALVGFIVLNA